MVSNTKLLFMTLLGYIISCWPVNIMTDISLYIADSAKTEASVVSNLLFRGRIALDNLDIENIEDGTKDYHSHGVTVHHGWKVGALIVKRYTPYLR